MREETRGEAWPLHDVSAKEGLKQRSKSAAPAPRREKDADIAREVLRIKTLPMTATPAQVTGMREPEDMKRRVKELLLELHPDKRRETVTNLAGGTDACNVAFMLVQGANVQLRDGWKAPGMSPWAVPPRGATRSSQPAPPPPRRAGPVGGQPQPPPPPPPQRPPQDYYFPQPPPPAPPPPPLEEKPEFTLRPMPPPPAGWSFRVMVWCD